MIHAKKMMLVPASEAYAQQMLPPAVPQMVNLDSEIGQILDSSNSPANMKLVQYNQILQGYMKLHNDYLELPSPAQQQPSNTAKRKLASGTVQSMADNEPAIPFTDGYILNAVRTKDKNTAALLLDFIKRSKSLN